LPTRILIGGIAGLALAVGGCGDSSVGAQSPTTAVPASAASTGHVLEAGRNVVRVPGISPADVAAAAVLASYDPAAGGTRPEGFVLIPTDSWPDAVIASQFAAKPVSAALLAVDRQFIPTAPSDVLARIRPTNFPKAKGLQVLVVDKLGSDVYVDLQDLDLKPTALTGNPVSLAAELVPFRGGWAGRYSDTVVIVSVEARDYALPAAAWSAYSGDTVAFVRRDSVPKATRALLIQREKLRLRKPSIYIIGPSDVISSNTAHELKRYGPVHRIAGHDAIETAVALARYHDPQTGFGWGMSKGPGSISLVNVQDWPSAIAAFTFAATGPQAPLLLTDNATQLPSAVRDYLRGLRGRRPSQGYVLGGREVISSQAVTALDDLLAARG
jgi:ell wall binding domain 2 (CWB2)